MRIAVPHENGEVFQHFGHTEQFKLYDIENGAVIFSQIINTTGSGHGMMASFLAMNQVDTVICGGIGDGAKNALANIGIQLYYGLTGSTDQAVQDLIKGKLVSTETLCGCDLLHNHNHQRSEENCCHN